MNFQGRDNQFSNLLPTQLPGIYTIDRYNNHQQAIAQEMNSNLLTNQIQRQAIPQCGMIQSFTLEPQMHYVNHVNPIFIPSIQQNLVQNQDLRYQSNHTIGALNPTNAQVPHDQTSINMIKFVEQRTGTIQPSLQMIQNSQIEEKQGLFNQVVDKFKSEERLSNHQIIENTISECRLLELMMAVEKIQDDDYIIIQGQARFKSQTSRGSKYRGVSKNGNKWQVLVMGNQKKQYSGSIKDELQAAKLYDKFAIKNLGLRAKTNFNYKKEDLYSLIKEMQNHE